MSSIYLGNFTTEQMVKRLGITLTDKEICKLEEKRVDNAQIIPKGKWHCFDIPFMIHAGDHDTAQFIVDILSPHGSDMEASIQIGIKD